MRYLLLLLLLALTGCTTIKAEVNKGTVVQPLISNAYEVICKNAFRGEAIVFFNCEDGYKYINPQRYKAVE